MRIQHVRSGSAIIIRSEKPSTVQRLLAEWKETTSCCVVWKCQSAHAIWGVAAWGSLQQELMPL